MEKKVQPIKTYCGHFFLGIILLWTPGVGTVNNYFELFCNGRGMRHLNQVPSIDLKRKVYMEVAVEKSFQVDEMPRLGTDVLEDYLL